MGPIVKTKKKGRPSKADIARRAAAAEEKEARRSRRRDVRYTFDFDELIGEEESERRRERKLKLLLKGGGESAPNRTRRVARAPAASVSSSEYGDDDNPSKRRKIGGDDEVGGEINDDHGNEIDDEDEQVRRRKAGSKVDESVPETPSDPQQGIPLPDKKALELILDKLQKKDTYGVYAEPVDPEELPDYHDVIEHPMDFATVRKKLGNGSYSTLEQFESDVLLICSNAMQYNAPDTIYYKQAHAIEGLARKKFQRLRINAEHYPKEFNSEHKPSSNSLAKKQINMPISWSTKEPVGSDFYSGTTLATAGGFHGGSNATQAYGFERLANMDGRVLGKTSMVDTSSDKAEDLQGRVLLPRFGRKPFVHDGNRRTTYNSSGQPVVGSDSIFTTFEGEIRQLVAVGIHAEHSYSRSLARFAATLGCVAWSGASKRIEQALPPEFKFGRGWVREYEPLSIPVLTLENCAPKEPDLLYNSAARKDDKTSKTTNFPNLEDKPSLFGAAVTKPTSSITVSTVVSANEQSVRGANLEEKQPFSCSGGSKPTTNASMNYPLQSPRYRKNVSGKGFEKQAELSCPPISANQNACSFVAEKPIPNGLKVPENHEFVARGLPNGKVLSNSLDRNTVFSSSESIPKQLISASYVPQGQHQGLSDPVHLVGILGEIAQEQQETMNHPPVMPSVPSSRRDDPNNAASAAARAWMEIGAGATKSAAENTIAHKNQISISSQFQGDFPVWVGNETQFRNRPVDFSESVMTDLSRFQMLTTWRGLNPQRQQSQKQESFPPDLNIGVQSSGSPVRQSSDLALHL